MAKCELGSGDFSLYPVLVDGSHGSRRPNHVPSDQPVATRQLDLDATSRIHARRVNHEIGAMEAGPVTTSVSHPSRRCTSFNLAGMLISCVQVGRQSPQPTQDVPFFVKAAYSCRARSRS